MGRHNRTCAADDERQHGKKMAVAPALVPVMLAADLERISAAAALLERA